MTRRAAIYARFSSARQREESIEDQVRVCRDYAERNGMRVVRTYKDEARSGTDATHRPGFQRAVADAQKGRFDVLLVYKQDRFARNRFDSAMYKSKLRRAGVELVSATESVPDGPEGIILDSVLEGMAEYYSANLSQNVLRGMEGNARKCRHNGVRVYGYDYAPDGTYAVNDEEAERVREAFRLAASGLCVADICRDLNNRGLLYRDGRKWGYGTLHRLLRNDKYTGVYRWGNVVVEGGMPRIVSDRLWDRAQDMVGGAPRKKAPSEKYLLSGILFTDGGERFEPNCGRSQTGVYHYYYRCRATGQSIRRDELDARVRNAVSGLLKDKSMDEEIVSAVMRQQEIDAGDEVAAHKAVKARLRQIKREQDNLIDLAAKTGATDRVAKKLDGLERERAELEAEAAEIRRSCPVIEPDMVRFFLHKLRKSEAPDAAVRGFVTRVVLSESGSCKVLFAIGNSRKKSQTPSSGRWFGKFAGGGPSSESSKLFVLPGFAGFALAA